MIIGVEYKYAILAVLSGGIGGFLFFFYLGKPVNRWLNGRWPAIKRRIPTRVKTFMRSLLLRKSNGGKTVFSKRSRFFIRLKSNYGFWGIIIATPVILTIPVGAFLASKYYPRRKNLIVYMIISITGWAMLLSGVIHLFPNVFL